MRGAEVIAHVDAAVGSPRGPEPWRTHVVSRAAEPQRFVVGADNAAADQACTSLIVSPAGRVPAELPVGETAVAEASIDLREVSDWIIGQARGDVVSVGLRHPRGA